MATKSQLITSVNGHLTEVIDIADHRASMLDLINQLYPAMVQDTQATTNVFARGTIQTNFNYSFKLKKTGNIVFISGQITNNSSTTAFALGDITAIINTEYQPQSTQNIIGMTNNNNRVLLTVVGSGVNILSGNGASIPANGYVDFNGFYFTND
jgi:ethanolamine utilization protein EutA (predicted chaperonin)